MIKGRGRKEGEGKEGMGWGEPPKTNSGYGPGGRNVEVIIVDANCK
jgi:hypothetical protein